MNQPTHCEFLQANVVIEKNGTITRKNISKKMISYIFDAENDTLAKIKAF